MPRESDARLYSFVIHRGTAGSIDGPSQSCQVADSSNLVTTPVSPDITGLAVRAFPTPPSP